MPHEYFLRRPALSVVILLVALTSSLAQAFPRRALALTDLEMRTTTQRGLSAPFLARLRTAVIEHLELMGETVQTIDGHGNIKNCKTRDCQISLAKESNADLLYGEISQTDSTNFDFTIWIWRFDTDTGAPITDYPISNKGSCEFCDESIFIERLLKFTGELVEKSAEQKSRLEATIAPQEYPLNRQKIIGLPSASAQIRGPAVSEQRILQGKFWSGKRKAAVASLGVAMAIGVTTIAIFSYLNPYIEFCGNSRSSSCFTVNSLTTPIVVSSLFTGAVASALPFIAIRH